jgi:hypothetical protein
LCGHIYAVGPLPEKHIQKTKGVIKKDTVEQFIYINFRFFNGKWFPKGTTAHHNVPEMFLKIMQSFA